ncbi:LssY C-terminal domain-containing protein [Bradyrhizobium arachidis]|uniref:LssY C-terminal domain-containing protein n=1 Tax=Bradyrhizobium arachidis TaxID=858423 RepID=UPI0038D054E8
MGMVSSIWLEPSRMTNIAKSGTRKRRWRYRLAVVLLTYLALAYFLAPLLWIHHEREAGLASLPMVTRTSDDIPADPLNVGLVGSGEDVVRAMNAAGWFAADAVTLRSSIEIVGSVVLDRPYRNAPVSPLYYLGKKEQYAFEKPAGNSADRRNHVRFWKALEKGDDGRPVWLGAATFDRGVGLSHDTGQVTHHIDANIDAERDLLMTDLHEARVVSNFFQISGIGPTMFGRNGGGDPYYTDGERHIAVLVPGAANGPADPPTIPPPALIALKDAIWHGIAPKADSRP